MKSLFVFILLLTSSSAFSEMPHLDLEMTSQEYAKALKATSPSLRSSYSKLKKILDLGTRNLEWLEYINKNSSEQISFTSPETQPAFPIHEPNVYNPDIILGRYSSLLKNLPPEMRSVLLGESALTPQPPVNLETYIKWGFETNKVYEAAARWLLMEPHLGELANRRFSDLRGHYFLSKESDLKSKLDRWSNLTSTQKANFSFWLHLLCLNAKGNQESTCSRLLQSAINTNSVWNFYSQNRAAGQNLWNSYFKLDIKRRDVSTSANLYKIPFLNPNSASVANFLTRNIEGEWKLQNWKLDLEFRNSGNLPRIRFEAGVTPHVDKLGGNVITMDSNQPLTEYGVQWIIRHEFGHVIGFKDCYLEFYDPKRKTITAYQLDIENLMCSRRGHLKQTHLSELKRVYNF